MNLGEMEARLRNVEDQLAIDKLEKMYGYYLDNGKLEEAIDLFSDDTEFMEIGNRGVFKGKEGVKKFFRGFMAKGLEGKSTGRMVFHHQLQSVITVNPGGTTANGRWYILMIMALPEEPGGPMTSVLGHGVYENEFVKEGGKWKFKKMFMGLHFTSPINKGWTEVPVMGMYPVPEADAPSTGYSPYPNIRYVPFHWKEPAQGDA